VYIMKVSVVFHLNRNTAIKFRWVLHAVDFAFTAVGSGKFLDLRRIKVVENLGFHLKKNFVVHAGHPKNSEVRVLKKKASARRREKEEKHGSRF